MDDLTQSQVLDWLATGCIGTSSKCMALWLAFGRWSKDWPDGYPYDPADFDRCLLLLAKAPGLRQHLSKMAEVSPEWAALVARWDEVERSHLAEVGLGWSKGRSARKTYDLMWSIYDGVHAPAPEEAPR